MALRHALGDNAEVALTAAVHGLALDTFFRNPETRSCLEITARQPWLGGTARGIEDGPLAQAIHARHEGWAKRFGDDPGSLFGIIAGLTQAERLQLLAHCVSLTLDAVLKNGEVDAAEDSALPLAAALGLDMAAHWQPTPANYLGRVSKQHILAAVGEAVSKDAADNIAGLKKAALAEAAATRLKDRGWLPAILRTPATPMPQAEAA
jgi:ParB family chromosome partitioning protein